MRVKAKLISFAAILCVVACSASAYEISFDKACDIVGRTDTTLDVRVVASYDICGEKQWDCHGSVYTLVPSSDPKGKRTKVITSNTLGTGDRYTLLVSSTRLNRRVFLYNLEHRTFIAPDDVDYFLDTNAAFQSNGATHFRRMPLLCNGDGPDCSAISSLRKPFRNALMSVSPIYPALDQELASCPR
jgi:hypothetical protein